MINDKRVLRNLANEYKKASEDYVNLERKKLHICVNDKNMVRPIVLLDELPWHELNQDGELTLQCENSFLREVEKKLRRDLYKWKHCQADMILRPYISVSKVVKSSGNGISVSENTLTTEQENNIVSHEYIDQMQDESFLQRMHNEIITYDAVETNRRYELLADMIGDMIPVKITGYSWLPDTCWDVIAEWHTVNNLLLDLAMRPEFMHAVAAKYTDIYLDKVKQYEKLHLFETDDPYLHSTSAYCSDLPSNNYDGKNVKTKDIWGRAAAQVFASVSPDMRDEFDITYMKKAMEPFGLVYYGCCEPLHNMIDIVSQIPNLRKISITPWADVDIAAEQIGSKYVMAFKPNPAFVAPSHMDEKVVKDELLRAMNACYKNGCSFDIVLKDISTVGHNPNNLTKWEQIAMDIVNNY